MKYNNVFQISYTRKDFFGCFQFYQDFTAPENMTPECLKKAWDHFMKNYDVALATSRYSFFWDNIGDHDNGIVTVRYRPDSERPNNYTEYKMEPRKARKQFFEAIRFDAAENIEAKEDRYA